MITFIIAAIAVALMMVGLSITLMRKGHDIQGEVGENPDMQALGLSCALSQDGGSGCSAHSDEKGSDCGTCTASCSAIDETDATCTKHNS